MMLEFDSAKGLFHMFFANEDEDFYTDSYIRTDRDYYLYSTLLSRHYNYIYEFIGDDFRNCRFRALDNVSFDAFEERSSQNVSFLSLFGGKKRGRSSDGSFEPDENTERVPNRTKEIKLGEEQFGPYVARVLEHMRNKSRSAVIIPVSIFNAIARYPELVIELKKISSKNYSDSNRHAVIITSQLYMNESFKFFGPDFRETEGGNIFTDRDLFPELSQYFAGVDNPDINCFTYDAIKQLMGDKAVFYRALSFENIRRMYTHYCLNYQSADEEISNEIIRGIAGVIYCYYNSVEYRCQNANILPENPRRYLRIIEESIRNERRIRQNLKNAAEEFTAQQNVYKYICNNYPDSEDPSNNIAMFRGDGNNQMLGVLVNVRANYVNRFSELHPGLERIIALVNKPSIEYGMSFSAVSCRKRVIEILSESISNPLERGVNVKLLDYAVDAMRYYYSCFGTMGPANDAVVRERDLSFGLYKDLVEIVRILTEKCRERDMLMEKVSVFSSGGDNSHVPADASARLKLLEGYIDQLQRQADIAENLISSTGTGSKEIIRNMQTAQRDLASLKNKRNELN